MGRRIPIFSSFTTLFLRVSLVVALEGNHERTPAALSLGKTDPPVQMSPSEGASRSHCTYVITCLSLLITPASDCLLKLTLFPHKLQKRKSFVCADYMSATIKRLSLQLRPAQIS